MSGADSGGGGGGGGYAVAKGGKLKLKGESSSKEKRHKSKKRKSEGGGEHGSRLTDAKLEDELNHAGGWIVESVQQCTGTVFVELKEYMYMHGLDNGLFVLGAPHEPTERPDVSELLTAVRIDDKHVAFKSAYGKYLSINQNGLIVGRSEAIGAKEHFQVEFDYDYDGRKIYIKGFNTLFSFPFFLLLLLFINQSKFLMHATTLDCLYIVYS